jgi:DNA-directed RNA polymerase subunit K/omega
LKEDIMAAVPDATKPMTVALLPGKPESKMRMADIQRKERQEQKEQDKKIDAPQKQSQSSTVVKISARAKELNRTEPVDQTSSAVKADNPTGQATKEKEASRAAPVPQPPLVVANTGSPAAPAATEKKA